MSPTAPATTITPILRRRRGLTEQAAVAAVDQACRRLRLPTVRAVLDEALTVAGKEQLSYQGFLAELLLAECDDRDRRFSIRRVKAANFPRPQVAWGLRFRLEPEHQPRHDPHPGHRGLDPQRRIPMPDRGLRNGQNPPAHRARHRCRGTGLSGQIHPRDPARERTRRSRRREGPGQDHRPLRPGRSAVY